MNQTRVKTEPSPKAHSAPEPAPPERSWVLAALATGGKSSINVKEWCKANHGYLDYSAVETLLGLMRDEGVLERTNGVWRLPKAARALDTYHSKWQSLIDDVMKLDQGGSLLVDIPADKDRGKFQANVRSILFSRKTTHPEKWSVEVRGQQLRITRVGKWPSVVRDLIESVRAPSGTVPEAMALPAAEDPAEPAPNSPDTPAETGVALTISGRLPEGQSVARPLREIRAATFIPERAEAEDDLVRLSLVFWKLDGNRAYDDLLDELSTEVLPNLAIEVRLWRAAKARTDAVLGAWVERHGGQLYVDADWNALCDLWGTVHAAILEPMRQQALPAAWLARGGRLPEVP